MKTTEQIKELCSCGFPQSHPIPHIHDMSERELLIYKETKAETLKAVEDKIKECFLVYDEDNAKDIARKVAKLSEIMDKIKELKR